MIKRALLLGTVVGIVIFFYTGAVADLVRDPDQLRAFLANGGRFGYLSHFAVLVVAGNFFPPAPIMLSLAIILPSSIAFGISLAGGVCIAVPSFLFARFIARDWDSARLPPAVARYDDQIVKRPFSTVVVIRLTFFLLPPMNWFLGLTNITLTPYVFGTLLGILPGVALITWIGGYGVQQIAGLSPGTLVALATAFLLAVLAVGSFLRTRASRKQ